MNGEKSAEAATVAPARKRGRRTTDIATQARGYTTEALEAFVAVMQDASAPAAARVAAATQILTWGHGKAAAGDGDAAPKTVRLAWEE
jgi:hypothetical protein